MSISTSNHNHSSLQVPRDPETNEDGNLPFRPLIGKPKTHVTSWRNHAVSSGIVPDFRVRVSSSDPGFRSQRNDLL